MRQPRQCEFTISAFESISGDLDSPKHTLPPNTVCRYRFQGRRNEIVWITFAKYHSAVDQSIFEAPSECTAQLRIWDGKLQASKKDGKSSNIDHTHTQRCSVACVRDLNADYTHNFYCFFFARHFTAFSLCVSVWHPIILQKPLKISATPH